MRARTSRAIAVALGLCTLCGGPIVADQVNGYVELTANDFETRNEIAGESTESDSESFSQRFNVLLDRRLFPNLRLRMGGFFERNASTLSTALSETDTDVTRLRPYFNLTLRTPIHVAELTYNRNEEKFDPDSAPSTRDIRETYSATLGVFADDLPTLRLDYFRTNAYDDARLVRDDTEDRVQLQSTYEPHKTVRLSYRGTLTDTENRLSSNEVRMQSHTARVNYADSLWNRRVRINSDYRLDYDTTDITTSGGGEVFVPLFPLAGLARLDLDPEEGALASNPGLIDGDKTASTGINLGLPAVGGDDRPRNIGVDLATETELNSLLVWVDRDLPPAIVSAFAWEVWVSDDNDTWTLHQPVGIANFGPFQRRFDVRFQAVTTRYIKVVVSPLSIADPFASEYPDIVVTEIEPQRIVQGEDIVSLEQSGTSHLFNFSLRTRLLERPLLYHELTYFLVDNQDSKSRFNLSNGLSMNHDFNTTYSLSARIADERERLGVGTSNSLLYTASLTAQSVESLRHRLVFSGRNEDRTLDSRDSLSVFLFTTARLFRGVDLNLGLGKTSVSTPGEEIEGDEINATATLVPHRAVTVNVSYRDRTDDIDRRNGPDESNRFVRSGTASIAFNPLSTLYLFGSHRVEERSDVPRRSFTSYSLDWSPFPDGTLQLGFRFSETLRSQGDAEDRSIGPRLRWNFARGSYLELAYRKLTSDSTLDTLGDRRIENETMAGTLRWAF